jgi:hypothetical protein
MTAWAGMNTRKMNRVTKRRLRLGIAALLAAPFGWLSSQYNWVPTSP